MLNIVIGFCKGSIFKNKKVLLILILINLCVLQNKIVLSETQTLQQKTVKQLVDDLKLTKTESDLNAIEDELYKRAPKTEEDMNALLSEIDHPIAAILQKVIRRTSDTALTPILINKCEEKLVGLGKDLKEADFEKMNQVERENELNLRISLEVMIETLGNLKDKRAIPTLKKFLDYTGFAYPASAALSMMGDDDTFAYLLTKMEEEKKISLAGIKNKNLTKIIEEIDKSTSESKRSKLIKQIKGSKDPEVIATLKTLAKSSPNADVRAQAGLALVNSIIADKNAVNVDFVIEWAGIPTKDEEEDWAKGWVINAMDYTWDDRYGKVLIGFLQNNRAFSARMKAARILGERKVQESVPYLEVAMEHDKDTNVRGSAWAALKKITGIAYPLTHPDDLEEMKEIEEYRKSKVPNARKQKQ